MGDPRSLTPVTMAVVETATRRHESGGAERGQATPLAVLILALTGSVLLLLAEMGGAAIDRAEARTAADAAALAGAVEGPTAARELAAIAGGEVIDSRQDATGFTVTVRVGDATTTARAEAIGGPTGGGSRTGLAPGLLAAIDRAESLLGRPITIVSGFRSRADQQRLWDNRATNPFPVAPPGTSRHESGLAIDVPADLVADLRRVGPAAGLCSPLPVTDPVHFELCRWSPR